MHITVLNEVFLTEQHIKRLEKLGKVTLYKDTTTEEEAIERIKNADSIFQRK